MVRVEEKTIPDRLVRVVGKRLSEGKQVERVDDDDGPSIASPGAAPEQVDSMP